MLEARTPLFIDKFIDRFSRSFSSKNQNNQSVVESFGIDFPLFFWTILSIYGEI